MQSSFVKIGLFNICKTIKACQRQGSQNIFHKQRIGYWWIERHSICKLRCIHLKLNKKHICTGKKWTLKKCGQCVIAAELCTTASFPVQYRQCPALKYTDHSPDHPFFSMNARHSVTEGGEIIHTSSNKRMHCIHWKEWKIFSECMSCSDSLWSVYSRQN